MIQAAHLTQSFLADKIAARSRVSTITAHSYAKSLYETAQFYHNKYGEKYFTMSMEITCRLCGSNLAELNEYIRDHTGIDNYYKK